MRKLFCNKRKDIGAIGIGAMIVLIAMILVAGVAASVLISTSNTLQSQALRTGSQTTREVSSGIRVSSVTGLVNTTENDNVTEYDDIWCLAITVEPRPGSDRIDLNNTFVLLSDGNKKALLTYHYNDSDYFASNLTGDIFDTGKVNWSNLSSDKFGIGVLQDADTSISQFNPVLNRGDKAVLFIYTNTSAVFGSRISERKEIFGQVIPEIGSTGVISFTSPKAYVNTVYTLQ
jgi:archaeal flagellin FlaB